MTDNIGSCKTSVLQEQPLNILKYKDFYGSVEYSAAKEGISLNAFVERAISDEVSALV